MSASGMYGATRVGAGLVGNADLCLGEAVGDVLDALAVAGGGRFRGVRDQANWEADERIRNGRFVNGPHAYMDPDFRVGFSELEKRDLSFEAWCFHTQITELTDLAQKFPNTRIVLNHFGGPLGVGPYAGRQDEVFEIWKGDVAKLAGCPNVYAKLGGINMDINGFGWEGQDRPPESATLMDATPSTEQTISFLLAAVHGHREGEREARRPVRRGPEARARSRTCTCACACSWPCTWT